MLYFSIAELIKSVKAAALGIDNKPGSEYKKNLEALVDNVLDPVRMAFGRPISVTSGFRCERLNKAVGGAGKSQHLRGEAADIVAAGAKVDRKANHDIGVLIARQNNFDQLIFEDCGRGDLLPEWIHVSYSRTGSNRHDIKKMLNGVYSTITLKDLGIEPAKTNTTSGKKVAKGPQGKKAGINTAVL